MFQLELWTKMLIALACLCILEAVIIIYLLFYHR